MADLPTTPASSSPHRGGKGWRAWIQGHKKQATIGAIGVGGAAALLLKKKSSASTAATTTTGTTAGTVYPPDQTAYDSLQSQLDALSSELSSFGGGGSSGGGGFTGTPPDTSGSGSSTTGTSSTGAASSGASTSTGSSTAADTGGTTVTGAAPPPVQTSTGTTPPALGNDNPIVSSPGNGPAPAPAPKPSIAELAASVGLVGLSNPNEARYVLGNGHQTWFFDGGSFASTKNKTAPKGSTLYAEKAAVGGYNPSKTYKG